ncbi:MAG: hypothetical protein QM582_16730 [Micropruina sp.]|uniref:hypothetical protein n=1 Tax=Micropruina sp. TaxID=2737536 RepID=UPI0039E2710E
MPALPTAALRSRAMRWGAFAVRVDADGTGFELLHGEDLWARFTLAGLRPTGRFTDDADEVEHGFAIGDAGCAVRHAVGEAWSVRWALRAADPVSADGSSDLLPDVVFRGDGSPGPPRGELCGQPRLSIRPGPGCVVWAWAAGAEGLIAIGPAGRAAPVVGLRLTQGWLRADGDGFALAPADLALSPGRRWVGTLRADLYPTMDALGARLPAWLAPLELTAGQPWEFRDPDHALVVQPPATTRAEGDAVQVIGRPGRAGVTLHSPRGLTALTVSFAPMLETLLAAGASQVLRGREPVTPAGAFVVAEAQGRALVSAPSAAERLLDDRDWSQDADLLAIATGIVRGQRSGNARMLRAALRRLQLVHPQPGYGRVVMAAWLASLALGEDAREEALALLSRPSGSGWVALELNVLNLRSQEVSGGSFAGLINALGGDLPGEPVGVDAVRQAQLVGLLQLCPEEWPMAQQAAACATKNSRRLLASVAASDFSDPDDLAVLAWLALGQSLV